MPHTLPCPARTLLCPKQAAHTHAHAPGVCHTYTHTALSQAGNTNAYPKRPAHTRVPQARRARTHTTTHNHTHTAVPQARRAHAHHHTHTLPCPKHAKQRASCHNTLSPNLKGPHDAPKPARTPHTVPAVVQSELLEQGGPPDRTHWKSKEGGTRVQLLAGAPESS